MWEYAERVGNMKASEIRELLKFSQQPDVISFAGGLPSPHSFPVKQIIKISTNVLKRNGGFALQYGPTEGLDSLRESICERMRKIGIVCEKEEILISAGAQQALDLIGKILINPEDAIIVETPTYLGALTAFNAYQPIYIPVPMDKKGMKIRRLEKILSNTEKEIDFVYTCPTFQNPTGVTMSLERRKDLLKLAKKYNFLIVEDDAYHELRYSGKEIPPIKSFDKDGLVVYLGTFSKILAPGFRLGWAIGEKKILRKMVLAKQGVDLCTNMFAQYVADEYLRSGMIDRQIKKIRRIYRRKRNIMLKVLKKYFPKGTKWTHPDGGLFLWVTLPLGINTKKLFEKAVKAKVAYVHGDAFCVGISCTNSMRLNFSNTDDDKIEEGIKRLARVINE